jgi:hypothetical protein
MKSLYFLALLLAFVCSLCVTPALAVGDEWRPVEPAELALKASTVEKDADAEAIFWEVRIDDSSDEDLAMQHYVRVKIFTERGREKYSKFDIAFTKGMKIKDIAARVIKADGSIVEIRKEDVFEREIVRANGLKVRAKSFAIPSLEPGVIVEYRYREVISDAGASGMRLKFQRDIPVQTLTYYYKPYNKRAPNYQSFNFDDTKFIEDKKGFWVATRKDVPAIKEEPRMPPEDQVVPWMLLQGVGLNITQASIFSVTFTIKDPNNQAAYWASVANEKSYLAKFINKPDKEIAKVAKEVTDSGSTQEEKLKKLYEFCQTQIKNTSFDPSLTDEQRKKLPQNKSAADVLKNKTASSQFVDLLFGAMANSLGYETRIAFSGDRSKMFFEPKMTNEAFIHPAAIAVKVGDGWKFYNPGVSFLPHGMLLWNEEDVWALLVGEKNYLWVTTPFSDVNKSIARRTGKFKLLEDGTLEGSVRIEYTGQSGLIQKLDSYDNSESKREEDLREDVKRRMSTAELSEVKIENVTDPNKPLVYAYNIRVPGYAQRTGKRLFFQPAFFSHGAGAMFPAASRKHDVYFQYPWSEEDHITIELPKGFAPDNAETPSPITPEMTRQICQQKIRIGVTSDGQLMKYDREFFFGAGGNVMFPVAGYPAVKQLFDLIAQGNDHTITLKQTAAN